jgi:hypothetical protein
MIFGTVEATLLLMVATAFFGGAVYHAYQRSGDPLHPAIVLTPLFLLGLVMEPAQRKASQNCPAFSVISGDFVCNAHVPFNSEVQEIVFQRHVLYTKNT